jgi:hypothetical protein
MKKIINLLVILMLLSAFTGGCTIYDDEQIQEQSMDENGDDNPNSTIEYISLIADETSLSAGESTHITATATGENLEYYWSASLGDIIGSGEQITYTAAFCCEGSNTITCSIKDNLNTWKHKSVTITVN